MVVQDGVDDREVCALRKLVEVFAADALAEVDVWALG